MNIFRLAMAVGAVALSACTPTEEQVNADFDDALASTPDCTTDEECVVIYPGCPLACFTAVHRDEEQAMKDVAADLIEAYEAGGQACAYDCLQPEDPICEESRCTIAGSGVQVETDG